MRGLSWLLLIITVLLAACASTEPKVSGAKFSELPANTAAVPADAASLIVFWPESGKSAEVTILLDGTDVGRLERSAYKEFPVVPGKHRVAARGSIGSGVCEIAFEASGGSRCFLQVTAWTDPNIVVLAWGLGPLALVLWPIGPLLTQGIAAAADTAANQCGGHVVELVDEATARPKLEELRVSK
jgi:hypothetical protein